MEIISKTVVVTGATSFLGVHIIDLLKNDFFVYAIIRPQSKSIDKFKNIKNVKVIIADMSDTERWKKEISHADFFLHLGWDGVGTEGRSNFEIQKRNIDNSLRCLESAKELGVKTFIFAGSQAEYGIKNKKISEKEICCPVINYGKAKLAVLKKALPFAEKNDIKYFHLRIFSVYGEQDHPWTLVNTCIRSFLNKETVNLSTCEQYWNFLYVKDAAKQIKSLMLSDAETGIYNIAGNDTRKLKEFVEEIFETCGSIGSINYGGYCPKEKPANLIPDITKLESKIGKLEYTSFKNGILNILKHSMEEL